MKIFKKIRIYFLWAMNVAIFCFTINSYASPIDLIANFRLFGEVNRFSSLGWGNMDIQFGVNSEGNAANTNVIGRIDYNNSLPVATGVLSGLTLPNYGWGIVDHTFSVPFSLESDQYSSMFIGLGAEENSGTKQVIFDFSDNIYWGGSLIGNTLDQGLSLVSITLGDGRSLTDGNYSFEIAADNTLLTAFAVTNGVDVYRYANPSDGRAFAWSGDGTANSKIQGGPNRNNIPTEYLVNLDVSPEPQPFVWDIAGASFSGINNIKLTSTGSQNTIPEPTTIVLLGLGLLGLAGVSRKK